MYIYRYNISMMMTMMTVMAMMAMMMMMMMLMMMMIINNAQYACMKKMTHTHHAYKFDCYIDHFI